MFFIFELQIFLAAVFDSTVYDNGDFPVHKEGKEDVQGALFKGVMELLPQMYCIIEYINKLFTAFMMYLCK